MSHFKDRENTFENKYANDQEKLFRIEARACKLLGLWAAQEMSLEDANTYALDLVSHNLKEPGLDDVVEKVSHDMQAAQKDAAQVSTMLARFLDEAETQILTAYE